MPSDVFFQSEQSSLDTDTFVALMESMRHHSKLDHLTSYPLPLTVSHVLLTSKPLLADDLPDDAKNATKELKKHMLDFSEDQESVLTKDTKQYEDDKDFEEFKKKMNKEKQRAKEEANRAIDAYFNKMIKAGKEHPKDRKNILYYSHKCNDIVSLIAKKIGEFVAELVLNIAKWAKKAAKEIKHFFKKTIKDELIASIL